MLTVRARHLRRSSSVRRFFWDGMQAYTCAQLFRAVFIISSASADWNFFVFLFCTGTWLDARFTRMQKTALARKTKLHFVHCEREILNYLALRKQTNGRWAQHAGMLRYFRNESIQIRGKSSIYFYFFFPFTRQLAKVTARLMWHFKKNKKDTAIDVRWKELHFLRCNHFEHFF